MNNKSIKFISVTISNFRGVPGVLEVPLEAPLTVIHAANGTGKSTICHALEWLLTGKVEDLVGVTNFACEWGSGKTAVSAQCVIGGVPHELNREGALIYIKIGDGRRTRMRDAELLDLLTPSTVSGNTPQGISKAKRGWLRNSRWLYSNSLALLVDNNQAGERQKIFADILGLGHFAGTLRELREYRGGLPSVKGLEDSISKLDAEILELEEKLEAASPWRTRAAESILEILKYFQLTPTHESISDNFKLAKIQVGILEQRVSREISSFSFLFDNWNQYLDSKSQLDKLKSDIATLSQSNWELSQNQAKLTETLKDAERRLDEGARSVVWAQQRLDALNLWGKLLANSSVSEFFEGGDTTLEKLQGFAEFTWTTNKQKSWIKAVDYLVENTESILHLVRQKQQLAKSVVQPPADIAEISRNLRDAQQARVKIESEFNILAGVLERLKSIAKDIINPESAVCPLCHHDWEYPHLLHTELAKEELAPELIEALKNLENARKAEQQQQLKLDITNVQKISYEKYMEDVRSVDSQLIVIAQRTEYFETMNVSDFSDFKAEDALFFQQRIRAAIDFKSVTDNLEIAEQGLKLAITKHDIGARVNKAVHDVELYRDTYQKHADKAASDKLEATKSLGLSLDDIRSKSRDIEGKNSIVAALTNTVSQFDTHWKEAVGDQKFSTDAYNTALATAEERSAIADSFKTNLEECEAIVSVEIDESHISKLKDNREALTRKVAAGRSYISQADRTIEHYAEFVREQTTASLSPLLSPASELFSRMHANEVYRKLSVSEEGEAFKWTVFADGHEDALDAEEKFSQGQRQDLALSLYLAKACSTGGSFFLDEPIAHLDDLNRVAMLDIFRLVATSRSDMNLVLTTASDGLARHLAQKFSSITDRHLLSVIHLDGNPRTGVKATIRKNISV